MNDNKTFILTETELEKICGRFFDRGYYSALYQQEKDDKSIDVWNECKKSFFDELF